MIRGVRVKGTKFLEFENYLKNSKKDHIELTFAQIEGILGDKLSPSAYNHVAYWHLSETHTFPIAWLNAGYKMNSLDLRCQTVSFLKDGSEQSISKSSETKQAHKLTLYDYIKKPQADIDFIVSKAGELLEIINSDVNSRYKSWEHCYTKFADCKELNPENHDILSLHLAFYLASWGMLRGSSFLLHKDYKVHFDVVKELYKPEYKPLWGINSEVLLENDNIDLVFELSERLREIYIEKRKNLDGYEDISNILVTKILMGTLGCVPAYDRFFVKTIKEYKIASGNYNKQSLYDLAIFYNANREKIELFRNKVNSVQGINYPEMKILDMAFWYIAFEKDSNKLE